MSSRAEKSVLAKLANIDPRVIYLLVALAIATPLLLRYTLPPARMATAKAFYTTVDTLQLPEGNIALVSLDWGPGGVAENQPQTLVTLEHLFRRRIPFAILSMYPLAAPFLEGIPEKIVARLQAESPNSPAYEYGKDWVNLGYRPNGFLLIQSLAKSSNWKETLEVDSNGTPLTALPLFNSVSSIKNVSLFIEITGLVGVFNNWIQYFQTKEYRPPFLHGCTSITIPEAYNYFASGQIVGLHEGVAGAASYEQLLSEAFPHRSKGDALRNNTSIAVAQLVVLGLILLGNIGAYLQRQNSGNK